MTARVRSPLRSAVPSSADPSSALTERGTNLLPRVIPCLDIKGGRVVKGVRFQGLRDAGDPVERAALYEAQGADELVMLDVSATPEARSHAVETVAGVRAVLGIPLTVGGGVREPEDARRLLAAGADKVGVNTAAVQDPGLLSRLADRFGVQCTILAVDAARRSQRPGGPSASESSTSSGATPPRQHEQRPTDAPTSTWEVVTHSGRTRTGLDAVAWCVEAERRGAGEILLTSWDRDGTGEGFDEDLLRAVRTAVSVPVIASGGAKTPEHMGRALTIVDACLAASMFHDGKYTVGEVKAEIVERFGLRLRDAGRVS